LEKRVGEEPGGTRSRMVRIWVTEQKGFRREADHKSVTKIELRT
jgi:hypothetical protein